MRVIAGALKGREFKSPHGHRTHPMSDKVRGAIFNALGDIEGLTVLDAFAGSGALGFEALSRGAAHVTAIDVDKNAQRTIAESIVGLDLNSQFALIKASAAAWLSTTNNHFDVILLDPPYDAVNYDLLIKLADRANSGGMVVISVPPSTKLTLPDHFQQLTAKNYGDAMLLYYRRD